jgi:16S rRNA (guanine527-N7)-methyltransferase
VEHVADAADQLSTAPPAPDAARELFADRWPLAQAYVDRLATDGVLRGLIGPRERERLWDRHLLNCAAVVPLIGPHLRVADVGSGAGLPGIVIALLRPDLTVDLIEPLERRAVFLQETVDLLGLTGCRVVRARAESLAVNPGYDVVTARAVAPLDRLVGWGLPLLVPGGQLLALKGAGVAEELAAAQATLVRLAASSAEVLTVDVAGGSPARVVRIVAGRPVVPPSRSRGARRPA